MAPRKVDPLLQRFQGNNLKLAILDQQCVSHNENVANAILAEHELLSFKTNEVLITQDNTDNHMFFILCGRVSILVKGRELAIRSAKQHVGEMALIDPTARRSATVVALEDTVVAKVTEPVLTKIANTEPDVWRRLALELAERLRERSKHVRPPNPRPHLFIGCSVEGLPVAKQIQAGLSHEDLVPQIWTNNVFIPGHYTMEDLEQLITSVDFGVLVCTPDDEVANKARKVDTMAPRDNVILELGMCLGALGRKRTMIVRPRGVELKIPTDLLGITSIDYKADDPSNLPTHISPVCTQIMDVVKREKIR